MKKVTVTITAESAETTVELDGKTFTQKWEPTRRGAKAIGSLDELAEINERLYDELSGFFQTGVMDALKYDD